jgi:hypothetical protein
VHAKAANIDRGKEKEIKKEGQLKLSKKFNTWRQSEKKGSENALDVLLPFSCLLWFIG